MKWRYLSYNQKIAVIFVIVITSLVLLNTFLFSQYTSKSQEIAEQGSNRSTDKSDTKNTTDNTPEDLKNSKSITAKPIYQVPINTSTILSELDESIQSIDDILNFKDGDLDLSNLTK